MRKYNMRVANRAPLNKNGCYAFSEESINNIPDINIFVEEEVNRVITEGCKEVLRRSMSSKNEFRYGEQGLLLSSSDILPSIYEPFVGNYTSVHVDKKYHNIVNNRSVNDLVFIHNHPNNSIFSASDLINFVDAPSLILMIAVGNRHNIFIAEKFVNDAGKVKRYINSYLCSFKRNNKGTKLTDKAIMDMAAYEILKHPEEYGFHFTKLKRRNST